MNKQRNPEQDWEEFWKEIILNPDGSINLEQLKKELSDFSIVMEEVPKVYCHITGNTLSKCTYLAEEVISCADNYYSHNMGFTDDLDKIGTISDDLESLAAGLDLPIAPSFHIEQLKKILPEKVKEIRDALISATGENPWVDE